MKVTAKFNRCIEFTLVDGSTVTVKVMGDKVQAKADALKLMAAVSTGTVFSLATDSK